MDTTAEAGMLVRNMGAFVGTGTVEIQMLCPLNTYE